MPAAEVLDAKSLRPQGLLDRTGPTVISHRPAATGGWRARRILDAVTHGQVDVSCGVEVMQGDGAVYVKGFDYRVVLVAPDHGKVYLNFKTAP